MLNLDAQLTQVINLPAGHHHLLDPVLMLVSAIGVPVLVARVAVQLWRQGTGLDRLVTGIL